MEVACPAVKLPDVTRKPMETRRRYLLFRSCMLRPFRAARSWWMLGFVLAMHASGCLGPRPQLTPPSIWAIGPSHRLEPTQRVDSDTAHFERRSGLIRACGAANETIGFELIVAAREESVSGLEMSVDDFTAEAAIIPRDALRAFRYRQMTVESYPNWYLRHYGLREPRSFPDAMVPMPVNGKGPPRSTIAGAPLSIGIGRNESIYVEINIPPHATPGLYRATVTLSNAAGLRAHAPIELLVRDVFLKSNHGLPVPACVQIAPIIAACSDLDPRNVLLATKDSRVRKVIEQTFLLLREHGLSPYCDEVRPRYTQDRDGAVVLDWEEFDAICGPLIDGSAFEDGKPVFAWPIPVDASQPNPLHYDGMDSTSYATVLREYLAASAAHYESKDWLARNFVYFRFPQSVNPSEKDLSSFRRLIAITRQADVRLAVVSTLIPQPMLPFGWFDHRHEDLTAEIDIWATPARYQHPATLSHLQASGKRTWLTPDRPPYSGSLAVEAPLTHARSLPWQAFLQGHEAVWIRQATSWPSGLIEQGVIEPNSPTDAWLVYPGKLFGLDEPVPSARLKQLRTGLHEYQYLKLLAEEGRAETARLLARSLIKAAGSDAYGDNYQDGLMGRRVDDPHVWDLARHILCEETEVAVREDPDEGFNKEANLAAWSQFLAQTRRLEAWVESARVRADPRSGRSGYIATVDVAVRNELRARVQGRLSFGPLPQGAIPAGEDPSIGPLGEMQVARRQLSAMMLQLPFADLDGHSAHSVVFDAQPTGLVEVQAIYSIVRARRSDRPIRIDGNLSDWPPGSTNIAGDFRVIGPSQGPARLRAESPTIAYFCRDDDLLLIGIRAASPPEALHLRTVESNVVEYEDLRPVSGDLVEILLDPTGTATQPDDLYHIVIKSTGDPVFERGVSVVPPIGKVRPWPGRRPEYSVSIDEEGWTAELAIPIAALGPTAGATRVWGMNLARLEPIRGEYSDWARAPRHCYDPRALGNLVWAD